MKILLECIEKCKEIKTYLDASLSFIFELAGDKFFGGLPLFTRLMYSSFKLLIVSEKKKEKNIEN